MDKKAVILVSGGIDSSTVLASITKLGYEVYAISFNYGQTNAIETKKIKQIVSKYNVKSHKILNIDLSAFTNSALTSIDVEVPKYDAAEDIGNEIPVTYVPARNTIFLSYALGYAEVTGANDIFLGIHKSDSANYPDCRPEYIKCFEIMANLATKTGIEWGNIKIHAPLVDMTKAEIVAMGLRLKVDYSNTISCYAPNAQGQSCRTCMACLIRLEAFEKNNMQDPIEYITKN